MPQSSGGFFLEENYPTQSCSLSELQVRMSSNEQLERSACKLVLDQYVGINEQDNGALHISFQLNAPKLPSCIQKNNTLCRQPDPSFFLHLPHKT